MTTFQLIVNTPPELDFTSRKEPHAIDGSLHLGEQENNTNSELSVVHMEPSRKIFGKLYV